MVLSLDRLTIPSGNCILLRDISWDEFETILETLQQKPGHRIAYDAGFLEIMTPLPEHEYFKMAIGIAVEDLAEVLEIPYECYGSTTWRSRLKQAGIEPDNCFYIQHESAIRDNLGIDLATDPPPDLALEIDLMSPSLDRFPIYARLGVLEIWRYAERQLRIYELQGDQYQLRITSLAFPDLPVGELMPLIEQHRLAGRLALRRAVRDWAAQWRSPHPPADPSTAAPT